VSSKQWGSGELQMKKIDIANLEQAAKEA